ncbi:META domain-containing protein [Cryptosporangium sp. NPDC048952]|uniref:META domain-containing protein n=1 Tax=Cryptosporangium sp. NPDC048952 TaxID=3363961 RepID=UPI00371A30D2
MTRSLLVAALMLSAAGCTADAPASVPSPAFAATSPAPSASAGRPSASATLTPRPVGHPTYSIDPKPFHGTRWVLDHVVTDTGKTIPGPRTYTAYLQFDGRRVVGSGGCGEFSGSMAEKANILRFRNLDGEPIPCPSGQASTRTTMFQVLEADHVTFLFAGSPRGFFLHLHAGGLTLVLR